MHHEVEEWLRVAAYSYQAGCGWCFHIDEQYRKGFSHQLQHNRHQRNVSAFPRQSICFSVLMDVHVPIESTAELLEKWAVSNATWLAQRQGLSRSARVAKLGLASDSRNKEKMRAQCKKQSRQLKPPSSFSILPPLTLSFRRDATAMTSAPRLRLSPQPPIAHTERGDDSPSSRALSSTPTAGKARKVLLSFDELPKWHQDNEFILHGYRPISGSTRVSLRSWSYIHNESVNIYSHLIPAIAFLLGEWYILQYLTSRYSNITSVDLFIFSFFLLTAVVCLGLSTTYHTLMNHSSNVEQLWLRFDLVGIVVLTLGDFVSGIYMVFWCEPLERKIYWSMVS